MTLQEYAEKKLSDPKVYAYLKTEAIILATETLYQRPSKRIIEKMTRGQKEHNQHLSKQEWEKEYQEEHLDLIGYLLLRDYYNETNSWRNG